LPAPRARRVVVQRVSLVMPTYSRGEIAAHTISALREVEAPLNGLEVIVVDDGSSDSDVAVLERALADMPNARLLRQANGGPAKARNTGIRASEGALIVFLDDDCAPAEGWLTHLLEPFASGDATLAAVGGRVLPASPQNWVQRFC